MREKIFLSLVVIVLSFCELYSQQSTASIVFTEEKYDFGKIKEIDGAASHVFNFTNTGSVPLIIQEVHASCGCTSPDWTREPIMPGTKGFVKAVFNPGGRGGTFEKTLTVMSNADRPSIVLSISGEVLPKPPTVLDLYRYNMGDLRLKTNYIFIGKASPENKIDTVIGIINTGKEPLEVKILNLPAHITAEITPKVLNPDQSGKIAMTYDVAKRNDWGFFFDYLKFSINGKTDPDYKMTVSIDIREDFSKLTPEQLANAPVLKFEKVIYNFDTIKHGEKAEYEFKYKNTGKSDLIFRKFESTCGCTTVSPNGMTIAPGASSSLKVTFNSMGKKGKQDRTIIVVSNDPQNPRLMLRMIGVVKTNN